MLEDDFNDVIGKALRGQDMDVRTLAEHTNVSTEDIERCLSGQELEPTIRAIAPELGLNADRLLALKDYQPEVNAPPELHTITSPFGHLGVNAFVISHQEHTLIFDTGTKADGIFFLLNDLGRTPSQLFITHEHPDHIADIERFSKDITHLPGELPHGQKLSYGDLTLTVLDVDGHAAPARAYFIEGLDSPICIVGDAVFAGSLGGFQSTGSYLTALSNIHNNLLPLPENTIFCPGHGPLTTLAQEKQHNPFFS